MATIQFSNGQTVDFNGTPTEADVEEIAAKMGIHQPTAAPAPAPTPAPFNGADYLTQQTGNIARSIGNATGLTPIVQSVATAGRNIGHLVKGQPLESVDIPKTIGGYLQAGSAVTGALAPIATGATALTRIGQAAVGYGALGGLSAAGSALTDKKSPKQVAAAAGLGTLGGGALGAGGQAIGEAISQAPRLLAHTSNTPEAAMQVLQERPAAQALVGKVDGTDALKNTQTAVRGLRTSLTDEWNQGVQAVVDANNGVRVGLPSDTEKLFHKVDDLVGGLDGVPANLSNMSAKELIGLQKEVNALSQKTAYKISPEGVPVRKLADQLKELGVKTFGGENGAYATLYKNYAAKKTVLDAANDIAKAYQTGKPITQKTALARLEAVFNENAPSYLQAMKDLEAATGEDILSKIAAAKFSRILPHKGAGLATNMLHYLALPLTSPRGAAFFAKALPASARNVGKAAAPVVAPLAGKIGNAVTGSPQ